MAEAWPEGLYPRTMNWGCRYNGRAFTSTLSNAQQIVGYPGSYWTCTLQFDLLSWEKERLLSGLVGRMRGMVGTVNVPAFTRSRTDDVGVLAVAAASTNSYAIEVAGFSIEGPVFRAGDYLTVSGQMYEVVTDASAVGGKATLTVNKRIRSSIAPGTPIEYKNPYCEMRMTTDFSPVNRGSVSVDGSIELREAF